jgi:predicted DNA-binding transcriptional regulator YafY
VKGILKAWDYEKQGPRTFRMDKILAAEIRRKDITKKGAPAED